MLLTSKVIAGLLLPPSGLMILAFLGLIYWRQLWGRALTAFALLLLGLLSTEPIRDALTKPLEYQYQVLQQASFDQASTAIVLLGGGLYEQAPEYGGKDSLRGAAMMRTLYAADIAEQTGLKVFASGGKVFDPKATAEAEVMQQWLLRLGVKQSHIYIETSSKNTWQNAKYLKAILLNDGITQVVVVTSAWHMPRAAWCFTSHGFKVIAAPTDYLSAQDEYDLRSYLPNWHVLADSAQALHEYLGLTWYHWRYGA